MVANDASLWFGDAYVAPMEQVPGEQVITEGGSFGLYPLAATTSTEGWTVYTADLPSPGQPNPPPAPYFRTPTPNAVTLAGEVDFGWSNVPDAVSYRFQVATDVEFMAPVHETVVEDAMHTVVLTATGEMTQTYFYRSQSIQVDGAKSAWSPASQVGVFNDPEVGAADAEQRRRNVLNITPQLQHKDTKMICIDPHRETGIHAWDAPTNGGDVQCAANPTMTCIACARRSP